MVICGSYMFKFSVSKDMKKEDIIRKVAIWKVAAHLCLTLIVKELKISVEDGRVVTTLNVIKNHSTPNNEHNWRDLCIQLKNPQTCISHH